jgi:hypothetical protein
MTLLHGHPSAANADAQHRSVFTMPMNTKSRSRLAYLVRCGLGSASACRCGAGTLRLIGLRLIGLRFMVLSP